MTTVVHSAGGDFCDNSRMNTTGSCFTEISEIKYIESIKKVEIIFFLLTSLFIEFTILLFKILRRSYKVFFKQRI